MTTRLHHGVSPRSGRNDLEEVLSGLVERAEVHEQLPDDIRGAAVIEVDGGFFEAVDQGGEGHAHGPLILRLSDSRAASPVYHDSQPILRQTMLCAFAQ